MLAKTHMTAAILAGSLATAISLAAMQPTAQPADKEKCYGVSMKGKNDCAAGPGTTCAGTSKMDYQGNAWKYVAKGSCEQMKSPTSPTGQGQLEAFQEKKS